MGAPRPRSSHLAADAEGCVWSTERDANKKDIFVENHQDVQWYGNREGVVLPFQWEGERGSSPRRYLLWRVTKKPFEASQGTLLSSCLRNRTFPISESGDAALVSIFLLTLTALNSTISGALGPRLSQFPPVLLHSQAAGLGWHPFVVAL